MTRVVPLALLLLAGPAAAQTRLAWKWKADDVFYVATTTKLRQALVVERSDAGGLRATGLWAAAPAAAPFLGDRPITQEYEHTTLVRYTVKKRNADGSAVLAQYVMPGRTYVKGGGTEKMDTTLDGIELLLHVDARGTVTKVEGDAKLLEKLAGGDQAKKAALKEFVSEDGLKASATQSLCLFPPRPVARSDTWDASAVLKLGALGRATVTRRFRLDALSTRDKKEYADLAFTAKLTDYKPASGGGAAFQVGDARLPTAEGKGTAEIDLAAGRPTKAEATFRMAGWVTFKNGDVVYRTRLDQEQSVKVVVTDTEPGIPEK